MTKGVPIAFIIQDDVLEVVSQEQWTTTKYIWEIYFDHLSAQIYISINHSITGGKVEALGGNWEETFSCLWHDVEFIKWQWDYEQWLVRYIIKTMKPRTEPWRSLSSIHQLLHFTEELTKAQKSIILAFYSLLKLYLFPSPAYFN